jgi:competence protein ComEC
MRWLLLAFALGVLALQQQAELPALTRVAWAALPLAIALLTLIVARCPSAWRSRAACYLALFCAALAVGLGGFFYAAWRAELRLADELPPAWEGRDIDLVGIVDELPQSTAHGIRFAFAVERVATPGAVVPSRLSLGWYASLHGDQAGTEVPELHAGERWSLTVRLKRPHGTVNPNGFDVEAWLLENEFRATGYVRESERNRRLDAFAGRPDDHVARLREAIRTRILTVLADRPYAGVIAALAIGDERAIPNDQWRIFFAPASVT